MNYRYFLNRDTDASTTRGRELDLKVRMRLKRAAMPVVPAGRRGFGSVEARAL